MVLIFVADADTNKKTYQRRPASVSGKEVKNTNWNYRKLSCSKKRSDRNEGIAMKMHPVISSKIDVIGYDEQTHKLRVSFRKEKPCDFCHVTENTFTAFLNARSKTRFFKRNFEDSFPC